MFAFPLPFNPLNQFGLVSNGIATVATVVGLGAGLAIGTGMLAIGTMLSDRR